MSMRRVAVVLAALVGLSACGGERVREAENVARAFLGALADNRTEEACALFGPRVLADEDCAAALEKLTPATIVETEVWGDGAIVRAGSGTLFLSEFNRGWLVTAAGCVDRGEVPYDCAVGGP
ncbi:hypothetical protein [Actinokineospora xionganensis]|uniref:Lipoprotein n=1 Tax=Actinokineospora xionganensis TaxID=2684470 RepID=A0ABR7LBD1_9PSEU|nr:hypothetical protein [Actinokineospora xionganensis]MBC6450013.1 hypothetical protein [Actinokineospora xionganensis]